MPGGYYIALSGMQSRLDALDRVASDIANASTSGYKTDRATTEQADRPSFGAALQSAIDVTDGPTKTDWRSGAMVATGRDLDVAVDGPGLFAIDTSAGTRYTRNGHFVRRDDGTLTTADGDVVQGVKGPITLGTGNIDVDADGTVRVAGAPAGTIRVVNFADPQALIKESGSRFRSDATPATVTNPALKSGSLEQSNVSVVDRVTELTSVSRSFETLQRALSVLMNDVDGRAITELGRR